MEQCFIGARVAAELEVEVGRGALDEADVVCGDDDDEGETR